MSVSFGMPSLIELNSLEDNFSICKDLGLDFVEINMNMEYCLPENNDVDRIKKRIDKLNIILTMHFPEEIDFGSFYQEIREANITLFKRYCDFGKSIGVKKINIHLNPGVLMTLPTKRVYTYEKSFPVFVANLMKSLVKISDYAKRYDIKVSMENVLVPPFLEPLFSQLINIDNFYFTYDVGHDAKGKYNVKSIYESLGKKVIHMHLHDFDNHTDHQVLYKGNIDIDNRLALANLNDMTVVVEVKTLESLKESIYELRKRRYL